METNEGRAAQERIAKNHFQRQHAYKLSRRVTSVKLPEYLDAIIWAMPPAKRGDWLRRAILEAAIREQLLDPDIVKNMSASKDSTIEEEDT